MIKTFYSILKIYYLILGIIGVPVNLLAIVILSRGKCGLSTCTTRYLVAMAMADLLVIITAVILFRINFYYFPEVLIYITPVCSVIIALIHAATDCSVWFTVTFTFDRFVAICCQKLKTKYCTEKTAVFVLATAGILLCLKNVPFYFAYEPPEIISKVPWFCYQKPSYYTDPRWLGFDWFDKFLNPLLPIALILLLNALTVRHILVASRVRKGLRGHSKGENCSDPEMESRRKSVILLFTISGSFILLWLVFVIEYLYYTISGTGHRDYSDSEYIFRQVGLMIRDLSCCTNTFIYGTTQAKFREQVKSATWRFVAAAGGMGCTVGHSPGAIDGIEGRHSAHRVYASSPWSNPVSPTPLVNNRSTPSIFRLSAHPISLENFDCVHFYHALVQRVPVNRNSFSLSNVSKNIITLYTSINSSLNLLCSKENKEKFSNLTLQLAIPSSGTILAVHIILTVCHTSKVCAIDKFRDSAFQDANCLQLPELSLHPFLNKGFTLPLSNPLSLPSYLGRLHDYDTPFCDVYPHFVW
ncbi:probable G-protein coupled receptor 142 [Heterodontus francisci]|uniref:probable G-protein coupled receptor 142 n=1 Tax=Heterodontus francisci TaxID=7792 RepID=UPI00355C4C64